MDRLTNSQWRQILRVHMELFACNPDELVTCATVKQELAETLREVG